jgi:predicted  nucleic acid-binding Zn-ribbon protein
MKAAPEAQRRLLDLQAIDTTLQQLEHRRRTLPEISEANTLTHAIAGLEDNRIRAQVSVDDIDRDIRRLEGDIEQVRSRSDKDAARLQAGTGPARELEALQHEITSLRRRQSELEDSELELMEQRETAQAAVDDVIAKLASSRESLTAIEAKRDAAFAEIAKDEEWKASARKPLAADLPADLVALYDKIRETSGGLGAALVRSGRCGGCRIELSGGERARVKAAAEDDVVRCDECRRIMVRTEESGL